MNEEAEINEEGNIRRLLRNGLLIYAAVCLWVAVRKMGRAAAV